MRQVRHAQSFFVSSLLLALVALGSGGCENNKTKLTKEQSEQGLGLPTTSSSGTRAQFAQRCGLDESIVDPKEGTPEYVLHQLIVAASASGPDDANFKRFYAQFAPETEERWAKDQYWPRAKKFVSKYLQQDAAQGVVFKICERRQEDKDGNRIKFFIQSLDPQKSNPPIILAKNDDGAWKVVFFTP